MAAGHEFLSAALERIEDGFVALDGEGSCVHINASAARLLGLGRPQDLIGRRFWPEPPDSRTQDLKRACEEAMRTQRPLAVESLDPPSARCIESRLYPSPDGLTILVAEVSQRKGAQAALRASEQRFRHFFDAGLVGMAITVPNTTWGLFNQRLCDMLGYSAEQMRHLTWPELTHPDDLAADLAHFERVNAGTSDGYEMDKRFIRSDGSVLHASIAVRCERNARGEAERYFAIVADVGARKQAEAALLVKEAALASSLSGIALSDLEGRLDYVNPAFCALWHIAPEDAVGHLAIDFWQTPRDALAVIEALGASGRWNGEMVARRPDGSTFDAQLAATMVFDDTGRPTRMMASFVDITEHKAFERDLARHREQLEQLVAQRTAEAEAARDEAQRANRAKSEFLSRMSHELRTPMNAILGFSQLLGMEGSLSDRHQAYVREMLRAGRHLLQLINDVLDLASIESGRITLSPEPLALAELVRDALRMLEPLARQRSIAMRAGPLDEVVVRADRTRLRQVLLNLLSNAVKYNRDGGRVEVDVAPAGLGRLRVMVGDEGAGIPEERRGELFEPFRRLGAEFGSIEGTGIGLSIARQLVERMGGTIGVDRRAGGGSCFWFELPTARFADAPAPRASALTDSALVQEEVTVLYVEDNPANLKLVEEIVARHPRVRLLSAPSARLGFELARAHRPDLLLLDIHLPEIDGFTLLAALRAEPATRDIPAVALTAQAMVGDEARAHAAGFADYLAKPIDVVRFDALLERLRPLRR